MNKCVFTLYQDRRRCFLTLKPVYIESLCSDGQFIVGNTEKYSNVIQGKVDTVSFGVVLILLEQPGIERSLDEPQHSKDISNNLKLSIFQEVQRSNHSTYNICSSFCRTLYTFPITKRDLLIYQLSMYMFCTLQHIYSPFVDFTPIFYFQLKYQKIWP